MCRACLALLLSLSACTYDILRTDGRNGVEEGLPATVRLKFDVRDGQVMTRAGQSAESETTVNNIYLLAFDGDGNLFDRRFCTNGDGLAYGDDGSYATGFVELHTTSRNNVTLVGIANVDATYSGLKDELDNIGAEDSGKGGLDQLKALAMRMSAVSYSIERGASFVMTAYAKDKDGNTSIDIPASDAVPEEAFLSLERTDAKVKFVVTAEPKNSGWKNFSFLPKEWTVKQVPAQSYVLERDRDYDEPDTVYFNSKPRVFEEITRNAEDANLYTGGSFVFYMPENKKDPKGPALTYAGRDAWESENANGDKVFTNAHPHSTYVEMTGTLSYLDIDGNLVSADLRLTVHLGYSRLADGSGAPADVDDYDTERNCSYTYNVRITGIDSIIVEVRNEDGTGTDLRPGYEGDVVYSDARIFEFDSHYDRRLIKLNKTDIGEDMKWSVNTPFSRGIHDIKDDIPQNMRDYRWIRFAINRHYKTADTKLVKYPGDQNYNDPYPLEGEPNDLEPGSYYDDKGLAEGVRMMDVDQLIKYLQKAKNEDSDIFDEEGDVAITVFVDEYLYFRHPTGAATSRELRSLWKLTSDKEDRQLHIISQGAKYSPDGNSSIVNSKFSFKQRSIRTIFNVDKPELETAWGLESVMETDRLPAGDVSQGTDMRNGRANCLKWLVGKKWSDVISVDNEYVLHGGYSTAAYAAMVRNRDLDGDDVIDADEVRWYLASIDQLMDIYLGEYALDDRSRLYPANAADRNGQVRWHYTSSSAFTNDTGHSWILWAEEGASRGSSGDSIDDDGQTNDRFSYRCVRNLGMSIDNVDELPSDLVSVTDEGGGYYLIDMSNMNSKARRTNLVTTSLPLHDERSATNRPYAKFRVHAEADCIPEYSRKYNLIPSYYYLSFDNDNNWLYYQTFRGYPDGYRIPNQRELLIMASRMPDSAWPEYKVEAGWPRPEVKSKPTYVCQTAFSMNGTYPYSDTRRGFFWDANTGGTFYLISDDSAQGYVRPVQDVSE